MLLFSIFEQVPDPRKPGHAFEHHLIDVLCIGLCAMLSGAESFVDMEDYGRAKEAWLRERLGLALPHGIPSHDTFNRLFSQLDPQAFEACFEAWTQLLQQLTEGEILAIDGKSVRRSFDTATGQGALHLVSVWASQARLGPASGGTKKQRDHSSAVVAGDAGLDRLRGHGGCAQQPEEYRRQSSGGWRRLCVGVERKPSAPL